MAVSKGPWPPPPRPPGPDIQIPAIGRLPPAGPRQPPPAQEFRLVLDVSPAAWWLLVLALLGLIWLKA